MNQQETDGRRTADSREVVGGLRLVAVVLGVGIACLLAGCGYSRTGPSHGRDMVSVPAKTPRWPRNFVDLPTLEATLTEATGGPAARQLTMRGAPAGGGWIIFSSPGPQVDASSAQGVPESFRYCAWREAPSCLAEPGDSSSFEQMLVLEASAPFRMGFRLFMPLEREPRGLVIHQWGLSGPRYEQTLVDTLRRDGWAVLAYNGMYWRQPGALVLAGDSPDSLGGGPPARKGEKKRPVSEEEIDAAVQAASELAATEFDDAIGQYVLAHEAALEFVRRHVPSIPAHPLVVVGCSFGSLMTPALVTRLGDQVSACVLVGSGGSFLRISGNDWQDAYYSRIRRGYSGQLHLPATRREAMYASYLARSTLDPLHAAASLRTIPTLMLHARWDMIVQASAGEALWVAAGKPERWSGPFGHLYMFMTLRFQADEIAAWIDAAVKTKAVASPF